MSRTSPIQNAMNKLDIGDALQFKNAFPGDPTIEKCYESRISPVQYLSRAFKYPVTLLSTMFDTGCMLSGSRALDFFIPESTTADSDWDFYVPGYKESVADMINVLSLCGVKWHLEGDAIATALAEDRSISVNTTTLRAISSWISNQKPEEASKLIGDQLYKTLQAFKEAREYPSSIQSYSVYNNPHGDVLIEPNVPSQEEIADSIATYQDPLGQPFNILQGSVQTSKGVQPVQLIIGSHYSSIKSCLSFIKDFYASHVQCFISGWCASHMYYEQASSRRVTRWEQSYSQKTKAVEKAIQKYQKRGYHFHRADSMDPTIRRFNDSESMFLDYGDIYRPFLQASNLSLFDRWLTERRENINTIHWIEFNRDIFTILTNAYSRGRDSSTAAPDTSPPHHLQQLADIISSNAPEADQLRCNSLYSTMGNTVAGAEWAIPEAARSGTIYNISHNATPWSWML
ncbi:hypothetical protein B0J13DRAFT_511791 [Dactylonectria estremocensis]|uniref:Uncharacterized protein n=1 Tax=Dactylonectria estremocensis TaxID=1079267 RepID=A0A9P9DPM9_9HYPO|nr:hypothetical protein B0J13DRAFT_511791 [Dactylonectria estremocensis]